MVYKNHHSYFGRFSSLYPRWMALSLFSVQCVQVGVRVIYEWQNAAIFRKHVRVSYQPRKNAAFLGRSDSSVHKSSHMVPVLLSCWAFFLLSDWRTCELQEGRERKQRVKGTFQLCCWENLLRPSQQRRTFSLSCDFTHVNSGATRLLRTQFFF